MVSAMMYPLFWACAGTCDHDSWIMVMTRAELQEGIDVAILLIELRCRRLCRLCSRRSGAAGRRSRGRRRSGVRGASRSASCSRCRSGSRKGCRSGRRKRSRSGIRGGSRSGRSARRKSRLRSRNRGGSRCTRRCASSRPRLGAPRLVRATEHLPEAVDQPLCPLRGLQRRVRLLRQLGRAARRLRVRLRACSRLSLRQSVPDCGLDSACASSSAPNLASCSGSPAQRLRPRLEPQPRGSKFEVRGGSSTR